MNKNIAIGVVAVVLIAGGVYWFARNQNGASNIPSYGTTNTPQSAPANAPAANPSPAPITEPSAATYNVAIQNFAFSPAALTVKTGDTVVWTNKDSIGHTVTGNNGGPSSPTVSTNGAYSYTFNTAGTFGYHCSIHPSMTGTVTVQ